MASQEKFIIIPSHARTIYGLSGNELIAYGLIFGFSQDEKSWFVGGLQYVADWCGLSSKIRAKEVLQRLLNKGCIRKRETEVDRNIKKCDYQAVLPVSETDSPYLRERRGVSEKDTVVSQTDTNNIDSSTKDSIVVEDSSSSRTINSTSKNNSTSTGKESKKKEYDLSFVNVAFVEIFNEWLGYKKSRGESYKDQHSLEVCYRRLLNLSNNDPHTAQLIIEEAIANNYAGFFELKQRTYGDNGNQTGGSVFCRIAAAEKEASGFYTGVQ